MVPKVTGGWRPVLDLSPLNRFLRRVSFRMETPTSVREAVFHNDWAASLDLTDAYFHVLTHQRFRKWLHFMWSHQVFQFRALPFGLSLSSWLFPVSLGSWLSPSGAGASASGCTWTIG